MNVLFFLRPKVSTAYIYYDNTLRQGLEKLRHYGYTAIPVIDRDGNTGEPLPRATFYGS